jgi:hypothetical protein
MIDHTELRSDVLPGDATIGAENLERYEIELLLAAIQVELDDIGPTFGMQRRRSELKQWKDELLDRLLELRRAAA